MHSLSVFVDTYGYLAIFLGSIVEGETVVLLSGFLSNQDYLSFPWIIFYALLATLCNDWGWFLIGRYRGEFIFGHVGWLKKFLGKPIAIVAKKPATLSFLMRFMYGFRHIIPFSLGMSKTSAKIFFFWNSLGALVWVSIFGTAGYFVGGVLESMLGRFRRYELLLAVCIVAVIILINVISRFIKRVLTNAVDVGEEL